MLLKNLHFNFTDGAQKEEFADFKEEITLMKSIGYHKNIVNMVGCSTIRQPMCLLVEFMEHGDLLNYLRKRRTKVKPISFKQKTEIPLCL